MARSILFAALAVSALSLASPREALAQPAPGTITALIREVAEGYAERGLLAERAGRMLEAEVLYLRALETDPGLLAAHLGYARALDARRHRAEAVRVLEALPRRAYSQAPEAIELARALAGLGEVSSALEVLRDRGESPEAHRAAIELASSAGRFPEALAAARRLVELAREPEELRSARLLVRALTQVVGDVDAVRCVLPGEGPLRRLLRDG